MEHTHVSLHAVSNHFTERDDGLTGRLAAEESEGGAEQVQRADEDEEQDEQREGSPEPQHHDPEHPAAPRQICAEHSKVTKVRKIVKCTRKTGNTKGNNWQKAHNGLNVHLWEIVFLSSLAFLWKVQRENHLMSTAKQNQKPLECRLVYCAVQTGIHCLTPFLQVSCCRRGTLL